MEPPSGKSFLPSQKREKKFVDMICTPDPIWEFVCNYALNNQSRLFAGREPGLKWASGDDLQKSIGILRPSYLARFLPQYYCSALVEVTTWCICELLSVGIRGLGESVARGGHSSTHRTLSCDPGPSENCLWPCDHAAKLPVTLWPSTKTHRDCVLVYGIIR